MSWLRIVCAVSLVLAVACSSRERGGPVLDAGRRDAARIDAAGMDAATVDAGGVDAGGEDDAGGSDAGGSDAGDADAGAGDAGPTDAGGGGDGCAPPTTDTSAIGTSCSGDSDCPSGYVCQGFSGIVFMQTCQIRCETACCPPGTTCQTVMDKATSWRQCNPT